MPRKLQKRRKIQVSSVRPVSDIPAETYNTTSPPMTRRHSIAEMETINSRPPTPHPIVAFGNTDSRPSTAHTIAALRDTTSGPSYADRFFDSRISPMPDTAAFSNRSESPERSESPAMSDSNHWPLFDQAFNPPASQERLEIPEGSDYPDVYDNDSWPLSDPAPNPPAESQAPEPLSNEEVNVRRRYRFFGLPQRSRQPINIPPIGPPSNHSVTSSNHSGNAFDNTPASFAEGSGDIVPNRSIGNRYDLSKTREVTITEDQMKGCRYDLSKTREVTITEEQMKGCKAYKVLKQRCSRKSDANHRPSLERETSNETINLNRTRPLEEVNEPDGCLPCFMRSKQWKQSKISKHAFLSSDDVTQPQQPRADEEEHAAYQANRHEATLAYRAQLNSANHEAEGSAINYAQNEPDVPAMAYGSDAQGLRDACQVGSGQRTRRQRRGKTCPFWTFPRWWDFHSMTPISERPSPEQTPSPATQEAPNRQSIGRRMDGPDEYSSTETLPYRYPRRKLKMRADSRLPLSSVRNSYVSANTQDETEVPITPSARLCNDDDEIRPAPYGEGDYCPRESKSYYTLASNYSAQTETEVACATAQPIQQLRLSDNQRMELEDKRQSLVTVRSDTPMRDEVEQDVDAILPVLPEVAVHEPGPQDTVAGSPREGSVMGSEFGLRAPSTLRGSDVAIYGSRQASFRGSDQADHEYSIEDWPLRSESSRPLSQRWDDFDFDFGFDFSAMDLEEEVEKRRSSGALILDVEGF